MTALPSIGRTGRAGPIRDAGTGRPAFLWAASADMPASHPKNTNASFAVGLLG